MHHDVLNKLTVLLGTRREKGIIWSRLDIAVKSDQKNPVYPFKTQTSQRGSVNLDLVNLNLVKYSI